MIRPLNPFERAAVVSNDYAPFNVVIAVHLQNPPAPYVVMQALKTLQQFHPLLRASIKSSGNELVFEESSSLSPIPLKVIPRLNNSTWESIAEQEMNHSFSKTQAPLIQAKYIFSDSKAELILTAYHALIDGAASEYLTDQLLSLCQENHLPNPQIVPMRINQYKLPPSHRGFKKLVQISSFAFSQMKGEFTYRIKNRGNRMPLVKHGGEGKIATITLSKNLTYELSRISRRERITINSVLNTAQLLAVNKILYAGEEAVMQTFSFANLRPYLKPPIPPGSLGGWVTLFRVPVNIDDATKFLDLAKTVHNKITASLKRGDKFNAFLTSEGLLKMMTKIDKFRFGSSAINYSGVINIKTQYGDTQVKSIHGFVSAYDLAPELSSQARIFNNQIIWDFIYLDTDMGESTAEKLVQEIIAILENAVS